MIVNSLFHATFRLIRHNRFQGPFKSLIELSSFLISLGSLRSHIPDRVQTHTRIDGAFLVRSLSPGPDSGAIVFIRLHIREYIREYISHWVTCSMNIVRLHIFIG